MQGVIVLLVLAAVLSAVAVAAARPGPTPAEPTPLGRLAEGLRLSLPWLVGVGLALITIAGLLAFAGQATFHR